MTDRYENIRKALALLDSGDVYKRALGHATLRDQCHPDTIRELLAERDALRAERDVLARENEAMKRCATKYLEWLGVTHMPLEQALRDDMCNPRMCGDAALQDQENSDD